MAHGPITQRLIRAIRRVQSAQVVELAAFRAGGEIARELQATVLSKAQAHELHPVHAYWSFVQHHLSMFGEQVLGLPEADRIAKLITAAEDEYMPTGPPMSPLTGTYFFGWAYCDLTVGAGKETAAGCTIDVVATLGVDPALVTAMRTFAASRMGLWTVAGHGEGTTILGEAVTGDMRECVVPAGHRGRPGELWLARVLPPPADGLPSLVFTTPYVLMSPMAAWETYIDRTLRRMDPKHPERAYSTLMKHGLSARYWPEFVFEAYANHRPEAVFLLGLPDVTGSRPHGKGFVEP
ncbi:MAG: hypothetical protein Q8P41_02450 [Pseudomonadota bacterium]|nr:hypothetical protein [Pseudomonadota bacterium]